VCGKWQYYQVQFDSVYDRDGLALNPKPLHLLFLGQLTILFSYSNSLKSNQKYHNVSQAIIMVRAQFKVFLSFCLYVNLMIMCNLFCIPIKVILKKTATWLSFPASLAYDIHDPRINHYQHQWLTSLTASALQYKGLPFYQSTVQYWFFSWLGRLMLGLCISTHALSSNKSIRLATSNIFAM